MRHSSGFRSGSKYKLKNGWFSIADALRLFKIGDQVTIKANPAVHSGMPHPRYHGSFGIIKGQRGRAFEVEIQAGNKTRVLLARPEHIRASQ